MGRTTGIYLLSVSLTVSSIVGRHRADPRSARTTAQAPASSLPSRGQDTVSSGSSGDRNSMLREKEGRGLAFARSKLVDRIVPVARPNLRPRATDALPPLLWVHTCSVSLPQLHVRLQI